MGREFPAADINRRRHRPTTALRDIFVFNRVIQMLRNSGEGEVDEEPVLGQLAVPFPHEHPQGPARTPAARPRLTRLFL